MGPCSRHARLTTGTEQRLSFPCPPPAFFCPSVPLLPSRSPHSPTHRHSPVARAPPLRTRQFVEGAEELEFDDQLCMEVLKYSMAETTQPFTVVLAAFAILLHKYTREENVAIGSSTSE